ncbi:MAG TPA: tetratricopeptide repeat protein [Planctomycetota bacterium]|nr:tetratricopeptide repeat protein [Planctomycetota bacterium]
MPIIPRVAVRLDAHRLEPDRLEVLDGTVMSAHPRSRTVALTLSLVPGWGHVYWGREAVGLGIFTIFAVAGFALLNGLFIYLGGWRSFWITVSTLALVLVGVGSWISILRLTSPRRVAEEGRLRERNLREGMLAFLHGRLEEARASFLACLRNDPLDIEALFRLGIVCSRLGAREEARAYLKRAVRHDIDEKWHWEAGRELERLRGVPPAAVKEAAVEEKAAKQEASTPRSTAR